MDNEVEVLNRTLKDRLDAIEAERGRHQVKQDVETVMYRLNMAVTRLDFGLQVCQAILGPTDFQGGFPPVVENESKMAWLERIATIIDIKALELAGRCEQIFKALD